MAEVEFESPEELVHDNASGLGLEAAKVLAGSPVATQSALLGDLTDKVALITGGASGLGLAAAKLFIANGAQVVIADYSPKVLDVAKEIGATGVRANVAKEEDVQAAVKLAVDTYGKLDICVASAGIGGDNNPVATETLENWNKVNGVDFTGVMITDKWAIKQMLKQGTGGAIVNLASMFGLVAVPNNVAYSASKGGVVQMTRAAGTMYAPEGIRVNAVCPGVIKTPLIDEENRKLYSELHPMKRLGEAEEVAKLINFLVSDDAQFITGAAIAIDGGYTAV
ncbi:SDR family NAD(P)-dependent oxidoreductase [Curtanaerobium respiraculi]|jgi:NAD(P)-dependent dehydrogenase (short-subunit alcohol dehydrogenase family)|uniref:SDR family NAD(P)-dependent oxidoreductase n=1 Tax=Curtanaerobium respiraculi TaxID=2949669 RepID=UPI0024B3A54E|nr:SDR family oxidoreductase [Curtanaerobium respiraculi]